MSFPRRVGIVGTYESPFVGGQYGPDGRLACELARIQSNVREMERMRYELKRLKLLGMLRTIRPYIFEHEEKWAIVRAIETLEVEPNRFTPEHLDRMVHYAEEKLPMLPITRHASYPLIHTRTFNDHLVSAIVSTDDIDAHGSHVMPGPGAMDLTRFRSNPTILWMHSWSSSFLNTPDLEHVVGHAVDIRQSEHRLAMDIELSAVNPKAVLLAGMIREGSINATSIGFIPQAVEMRKDPDGKTRPWITKSELLEVSFVEIPSNPKALVVREKAR